MYPKRGLRFNFGPPEKTAMPPFLAASSRFSTRGRGTLTPGPPYGIYW